MNISMRDIPHTTALFADYLEDWPRVQGFYAHHYSVESVAAFARKRPKLEGPHLDRLCSALSEQQRAWGAGQRGVEKLAAGAVAVVTGQQPGLFTGPHLSLLKAISAIQLACRLEEAGIAATPVFWVAAEDHDHLEIESTWILNRDSGLSQVRVDLSNPEPTPAGWARFRSDISDAVKACLEQLPPSEFAGDVKSILESSYEPGASPVDAFAKMMAQLFSASGMTFVNPLHPELRRLAQPTIDQAIARNTALRSAVLQKSRALSEAGYHEQVKVDDHFTGLFALRGQARVPLRPNEVSPGIEWSANVLLRPVIQDAIFPTAAYVGGPAEIAYFAQAAGVYDTLSIPMPPAVPRISATILEPRVARFLEKYGIDFMDVFRGREFVKRKVVEAVQDGELLDHVRTRIDQELESLRPALEAVDATLAGALDTSRNKVAHQIETLRTKYVNAVAKRNESVERHLEAITNSLFPEKKLQERLINITSFMVRYGPGVVEQLQKSLSLDVHQHQLVRI